MGCVLLRLRVGKESSLPFSSETVVGAEIGACWIGIGVKPGESGSSDYGSEEELGVLKNLIKAVQQ